MRVSLYTRSAILVGPPHPVSNIRPVLYDALPHERTSSSASPQDPPGTHGAAVDAMREEGAKSIERGCSPYAVDEFTGPSSQAGPSPSLSARGGDEWAKRWKNIENDRTNHLFWLDSNTRFSATKQALISSHAALPLSPSQTDQDRSLALDRALARFYRGWQKQEEVRQREYTVEVYRRTWGGIVMAFFSQKWVTTLFG